MEISTVELQNKLLFPVFPRKREGDGSRPVDHRHERKFAVSELDLEELEWLIRLNPALFRPIYEPRYVNNVYLDTPDRLFFHDNVAGIASRLKVRIRWYGDTLKRIATPTLELKIKKGLAGWKESFPLRPMNLQDALSRDALLELCDDSRLPPRVTALLNSLEPALLNRYRRAYYLSADGVFRATLDSNLSYAGISRLAAPELHHLNDAGLQIVELKYAVEDDEKASQVTGSFPFRLSRNSKYVRGMLLAHPY